MHVLQLQYKFNPWIQYYDRHPILHSGHNDPAECFPESNAPDTLDTEQYEYSHWNVFKFLNFFEKLEILKFFRLIRWQQKKIQGLK